MAKCYAGLEGIAHDIMINHQCSIIMQCTRYNITLQLMILYFFSSDVLYDSYGFKHDDEYNTFQPQETLDSVVRRLDQQAQQKDVSKTHSLTHVLQTHTYIYIHTYMHTQYAHICTYSSMWDSHIYIYVQCQWPSRKTHTCAILDKTSLTLNTNTEIKIPVVFILVIFIFFWT